MLGRSAEKRRVLVREIEATEVAVIKPLLADEGMDS